MAGVLPNGGGCCNPGTVVVSGPPGPQGPIGEDGLNAFTNTTQLFAMPAEGTSVAVLVESSEFAAINQIVFIQAGSSIGFFSVIGKPTTTLLQLTNLRNTAAQAYLLNSVPGTTFASGAIVTPGGLQGPQGTQLTTNLTENEVVYAGAGGILDGVNLNTGTARFLTQASSSIPTWTDLYGGPNTWTGIQNFQASTITVGAPGGGLSVVNRDYVDARVTSGFRNLPECDVATTANVALTGIQTIDGIAGATGKRVLVKDQTVPAQNGIYVMAAGAWTRSADCDTAAEITMGAYVFVKTGAFNGASSWSQTLPVITLGTDPVLWQLFARQTNPWAGYAVPPFATSPPAGNGWFLQAQTNGILSWYRPQWYDYAVPDWHTGGVGKVLVFDSYESGYIQMAWKTMPPGATGPTGLNAFTTTSASFVMPAEGSNVTLQVVSSEFAALNQIVFVQSGASIGFFSVVSKPTATSLQLRNLRNTAGQAYLSNSAAGTSFASPANVTPGGLQGPTGPQGAAGTSGGGGFPGEVLVVKNVTTSGATKTLLWTFPDSGTVTIGMELTAISQAPAVGGCSVLRCLGVIGLDRVSGEWRGGLSGSSLPTESGQELATNSNFQIRFLLEHGISPDKTIWVYAFGVSSETINWRVTMRVWTLTGVPPPFS